MSAAKNSYKYPLLLRKPALIAYIIIGYTLLLLYYTYPNTLKTEANKTNMNSAYNYQQQTGINVTGKALVTTVPDIAIVSIGVQAKADTPVAASDKASAAINTALSDMRDNGIQDEDIQTRDINIHSTPNSYQAVETVVVKIRDLNFADLIIEDAMKASGDEVTIKSIRLALENPQPLIEQARKQAVQDAKDKAEHLAKLSDIKLGKIVYINEVKNLPGRDPITRVIEKGNLNIELSVHMQFAID